MQRMKEEHIGLVERMQDAYREIEEESKVIQCETLQSWCDKINVDVCGS